MSKLTARCDVALLTDKFAFASQRKEPLENAGHVRNALARFSHWRQVTDRERDVAWQRILDAANKYDVKVAL